MAVEESSIHILGAGPGAPEYMVPAARAIAARADLLVGARRLLDLVPEAPGRRVAVSGGSPTSALDAIEARPAGATTAVLVSGDPGLCSLARLVVARFGRRACHIVPGISSVQVAFARVGREWRNAQIVDAHRAVPEIEATALTTAPGVAVLLGCRRAHSWLESLGDALGASHELILCQRLTLPDEVVRSVEPHEVSSLGNAALAILLALKKDE